MFAVRSGCLGVRTPAHIGNVVRAVPLRVDGRSGDPCRHQRCGGRDKDVVCKSARCPRVQVLDIERGALLGEIVATQEQTPESP